MGNANSGAVAAYGQEHATSARVHRLDRGGARDGPVVRVRDDGIPVTESRRPPVRFQESNVMEPYDTGIVAAMAKVQAQEDENNPRCNSNGDTCERVGRDTFHSRGTAVNSMESLW